MSRWGGCAVLGLWLAMGCSLGGEAVRAAEPHLEEFSALRVRALPLAQMRRELQQQQSLFEAFESHGPAPAGLEAELRELEEGRISLSQANIDRAQEEFKQRFEAIFAASAEVLHAQLVFIDEGESSTYLYPEHVPSPVTGRWHGLRQQRTFCALADCNVDGQSVPCVVLQLRPYPHPGSAGLTVAFARD
jgi:hypothetical protein